MLVCRALNSQSIFDHRMEVLVQFCNSNIALSCLTGEATLEQYEVIVEKLKQALLETDEMLKEEKRAKKKLESKLRQEICKEMMEQISEIENNYQ